LENIHNVLHHSQELTILYVEDNRLSRETSLTLFEDFFREIVVAVNGKDGLDKFINSKVDLIITDISMPKMNGLEMIREIRTIDKDIPILVLSASSDYQYFSESITLGVDGFLLKPINIQQFILTLQKITEKIDLKREAEKSEKLLNHYKEITDKSAIISVIDTDGLITYANEQFCRVSEYSEDELLGREYHQIMRYRQTEELQKEIWETIQGRKDIWQGVTKYVSKSGKSYYLKNTIQPILDESGEIIEYIALRSDVTEIMNPKKQLTDFLDNTREPVVIYAKLEEFSILEEFYDVQTIENIQDHILDYLTKHKDELLESIHLYQLGNGEFVLACEKREIENIDNFIDHLKTFQKDIAEGSIDIGEIKYNMSMVMSIAYEGENILESTKIGVIKAMADESNFIISNNFAKHEHEKAKKNIDTLSMVKKAIENLKIVSYFQPIINNRTKEIEKYESLVRLIDESGKIVSPFHFLDVAKKGKYYTQITNIVLDNSFNALKYTNTDISINLSIIDIEQKLTREKLFNLLETYKKSSSRVIIELLEDESIKNIVTVKSFIEEVKKYGVRIAIDDFGAGYSNFERLLNYQPDILKIDGSLVRDIETNSYSLAVVKTIISFAKEWNLKTVAEFVENESIYNILNKIGVDYSQGYYFGKPQIIEHK
jgi:PAS domain S-box-containing protein